MAETLVTIEQLRQLAVREKADYAASISQLAELVTTGLEEVSHVGITLTLPVADWSGREQTVRHESLLANSNYWYIVCGDADCFMETSTTGIKADNITVDGEITFRCEITPDVDLTVNIIRLEVEI